MPGPAVPTQDDDATPHPAPGPGPGPSQQQHDGDDDDEDEFADDISVATVDGRAPPAGEQAPVDGTSIDEARCMANSFTTRHRSHRPLRTPRPTRKQALSEAPTTAPSS